MSVGVLSETGPLSRVLLKHARDAFRDETHIEAEWRTLNFTAPPDLRRAIAEYDAFAQVIVDTGAEIVWLPPADEVELDSIYVRDASVVTPGGVVLASMGKRQRRAEPAGWCDPADRCTARIGQRRALHGRLEGGDVVWLDHSTVAVGRGYRTNDEGISQFERLLGADVTCIRVPLPHWRGPDDVFHLMSIISPIARDLAVVYAPLLPVVFRDALLERGWRFVEVPDEEFDSLGANVLALEPGRCLMLAGNPITRRRIEAAGVDVVEYEGREISLKGGGGPTCLTRPLVREAP
jgi:N-dimethylarginine dimethylaminohydrolase